MNIHPHKKYFLNRFGTALKVLMTIIAITWLIHVVNWTEFSKKIHDVSPFLLFISYCVYMGYIIPYGFRWSTTAHLCGFALGFRKAVYWNFIHCFMGSFLPLAGSLFIQSMLVAKDIRSSTGSVMGTMLVGRIIGIVTSVLLLAVSSLFVLGQVSESSAVLRAVAVFILIFAGLIGGFCIPAVRKMILQLVCAIPFEAVQRFFCDIIAVFDICKTAPFTMLLIALYSLLNQLCMIVSGWILACAIPGFDAPWFSFFFVTPLIFFSSLIPSVGGYGVNQAATVIFFGWFGVGESAAAVYTVIRLVFGLSTSLFGAVLFAARPAGRRPSGLSDAEGV